MSCLLKKSEITHIYTYTTLSVTFTHFCTIDNIEKWIFMLRFVNCLPPKKKPTHYEMHGIKEVKSQQRSKE